jgi:two-component system, chemotaxis family, chemotaxis protein CheY
MTPRVLLVDDLPFMRSLLSDILTGAGMQVAAQADNGRDALTAYLGSEPDVVLLDIVMPQMDGITTLRRLRQIDPDARVVMCSALGDQRMIVRAIQLGARDFVVKPFRPERVVNAIRRVLEADGLLRDGGDATP